jgi:acyl-CoA synthetase (AMP-forming)/AMP-acid ligase II
VEVRIVDDAGTSVADGEVGTVSCRSGAVMRRYWDDPEGTAQVLSADGWLTTGDVGYFDAAGRLVLVGRKADMFIRGGYNVYPAEVEAVLGTHPLVGRVAVIGAPDPVLGELGVAVVAPAEAGGPVPTLEELREWCRRKLADYKAPDRLLAVDELPLTPMLKVDRQALAAEIAEALASPR